MDRPSILCLPATRCRTYLVFFFPIISSLLPCVAQQPLTWCDDISLPPHSRDILLRFCTQRRSPQSHLAQILLLQTLLRRRTALGLNEECQHLVPLIILIFLARFSCTVIAILLFTHHRSLTDKWWRLTVNPHFLPLLPHRHLVTPPYSQARGRPCASSSIRRLGRFCISEVVGQVHRILSAVPNVLHHLA